MAVLRIVRTGCNKVGDLKWNERHLVVDPIAGRQRERARLCVSLEERLNDDFRRAHAAAGIGLTRWEAVRVARRLLWLAVTPRRRPRSSLPIASANEGSHV